MYGRLLIMIWKLHSSLYVFIAAYYVPGSLPTWEWIMRKANTVLVPRSLQLTEEDRQLKAQLKTKSDGAPTGQGRGTTAARQSNWNSVWNEHNTVNQLYFNKNWGKRIWIARVGSTVRRWEVPRLRRSSVKTDVKSCCTPETYIAEMCIYERGRERGMRTCVCVCVCKGSRRRRNLTPSRH